MLKSILILITCAVVIFFGTIFIQSTVYAPTEINMTYEGFYFDFDNAELKQNVNVQRKWQHNKGYMAAAESIYRHYYNRFIKH